MKFAVEAAKIASAMGMVAHITDKRNTIPILSNVHLTALTDRILLKATDLDLEITVPVEAEVEWPGSTTLPAYLLHDIMRKAPAGAKVAFSLGDGAQAMSIRAGRSTFQLHTLPSEDFPEMSKSGTDFLNTIEIQGDTLHKLFSRVQFAISTEETRYYLNGIFLHTKDDPLVMRAVATDGHRLARMEIARPPGAADMPGVIVPRKAVAEIIKLTSGVTDIVRLDVSETKIRATIGECVLISKLIDGTYPDYERVIPSPSNAIAVVKAKDLSVSADRVSTISSERGRAVKLDLSVNTLTLSVDSPDSGSAEDTVEVDYAGDRITVGFNSKYLTTALACLPTGGQANLSITDPSSPARLSAEGDDSLLIILMPMRV